MTGLLTVEFLFKDTGLSVLSSPVTSPPASKLPSDSLIRPAGILKNLSAGQSQCEGETQNLTSVEYRPIVPSQGRRTGYNPYLPYDGDPSASQDQAGRQLLAPPDQADRQLLTAGTRQTSQDEPGQENSLHGTIIMTTFRQRQLGQRKEENENVFQYNPQEVVRFVGLRSSSYRQ